MDLYDVLLAKRLGGGGGGGSAAIDPLSVTANGTYTATGGVDGYSPVTVNVPQPSGTKNITANGDYDVESYASAHVSVSGITPSGTYSITNNGIYDILSYASVDVNVSGGGDSRFEDLVMRTISYVEDNTISYIGERAFEECRSLQSIKFANVSDISAYAFCTCIGLESIDMQNARTLSVQAFYECSSLTKVSLPLASRIGVSAFAKCIKLSDVYLPSVNTGIPAYAFESCASLKNITIGGISNIGNNAFKSTGIEQISFSTVQTIDSGAFESNAYLSEVSLPECVTIGSYAFRRCSALENIELPKVQKISVGAFASCYSLRAVSFPRLISFSGNFQFESCRKLLSCYLLGSTVVNLNYSAVFSNTPIGGYTASTGGVYGSIFVPASLYSSYLTANNWSAYSARFVSV